MSRIMGRFFQQKRLEKGWSLPDVVGRMPHWNRNKGCSRVIAFERGERELDPGNRKRLAEILEIGSEDIERIRHEEEAALKRAFVAWQARPQTNQLYYRAMSCVFMRQALPADLHTDEGVIDYARAFSSRRGVIAWLYLGRRERLAMRDGEVTWRRPFTWQNFRESDFGVEVR